VVRHFPRVTDATLGELRTVRSLRFLDLTGTVVTKAAAMAFRESRPEVTLITSFDNVTWWKVDRCWISHLSKRSHNTQHMNLCALRADKAHAVSLYLIREPRERSLAHNRMQRYETVQLSRDQKPRRIVKKNNYNDSTDYFTSLGIYRKIVSVPISYRWKAWYLFCIRELVSSNYQEIETGFVRISCEDAKLFWND